MTPFPAFYLLPGSTTDMEDLLQEGMKRDETALLVLGAPSSRLTEDEREWLWMQIERWKIRELELLMHRARKLESLRLSEFEESVMALAMDMHILVATRKIEDIQAEHVAILPGYQGTWEKEVWVEREKWVLEPKWDGGTFRMSEKQRQAKKAAAEKKRDREGKFVEGRQ